jgi:hypothetical protein
MAPFIKIIKEDIKAPIILLARDRSSSMDFDNKSNTSLFQQKWDRLKDALSKEYDVKLLNFGDNVYEGDRDTSKLSSTNISGLLHYIEDNYADQNLGAIIMASDGIYNEGNNPSYYEPKTPVPIYSIAMGDTTRKKDIFIQNILSNKIAYLGDKFTVQADIAAYNCAGGKSSLVLEALQGGVAKKISETPITVSANQFFETKTFTIEASQVGIIRYRLRLSGIAGEFNAVNNKREFYIDILDARQKILLLANAPHPDLAALKSTITTNKNYDVEIAFANEFNGNVSKYNMLVLHNLPSDMADMGSTISNAKKNTIPVIYIVGSQTSISKFNQSQDVLNVNGNSKNKEEITAEINPAFSQFTTSDPLRNNLKIFPPLLAPFGEYKTVGTSQTYLYQNIKKVKTSYPLIAFGDANGVKNAVIVGEGLWKWRLFDHLQHKNYDITSELINKTIQLASVKSDKRKFKSATSKNLYKDSEPILFEAQLYNEAYELINDPEVKLVIKDDSNKEFNFQMSKTQNFYTHNAGSLPTGSYTYVASTNYNGKVLTSNGRFSVESVDLEAFDLTAKHGLLNSLSQKTYGRLFYPSNMEAISDTLKSRNTIKPMLYQSNSTRPIIHIKWLFFLLLAFLTGEWFLRRYFGSY